MEARKLAERQRKQREIQEVVGKLLPASWLREGGPVRFSKSERTYHLANGARIEIKSADRPELLKAGGVACIAVNEAQQVAAGVKQEQQEHNVDPATAKAIAKELRDWVAKEIGPIAKPKDIRFGENLPKTRSGKIMRRLLRSIAKGEAITQDTSTLENPAILDQLGQAY